MLQIVWLAAVSEVGNFSTSLGVCAYAKTPTWRFSLVAFQASSRAVLSAVPRPIAAPLSSIGQRFVLLAIQH